MIEQNNRYRYRCRHTKRVPFHFLSQLDLTRFWDRALRRAKIPVDFSKGFNPRPLLSFGPATPTGVISLAEYFDIVLLESIESEKLKRALNLQVPREMNLIEVDPISLGAPSIMKALLGIEYTYVFELDERVENGSISIPIESIDILERKILGHHEYVISFLFKGKSILLNPFRFINQLPKEMKLSQENLIEIIKQNYKWSL